MRTLKEAQISLLLNIPLNWVVLSLYCLTGLILYASYAGCDPKSAGAVTKAEEVLPYFVMKNLAYFSGKYT